MFPVTGNVTVTAGRNAAIANAAFNDRSSNSKGGL